MQRQVLLQPLTLVLHVVLVLGLLVVLLLCCSWYCFLGRVLGAQVPGLCPGSPVPARAPGCQHTARPGWRVAAGQMAPGG